MTNNIGSFILGTAAIAAGGASILTALASAPVSAPIAAAGGMLLGGTAAASVTSGSSKPKKAKKTKKVKVTYKGVIYKLPPINAKVLQNTIDTVSKQPHRLDSMNHMLRQYDIPVVLTLN